MSANSTNDSIDSGAAMSIAKLGEYALSNDFAAARELLYRGVDVNSGYDVTWRDVLLTPLTAAMEHGSLPAVKFLLANGANPNYQCQIGDKYGHHPLSLAVHLGNLEILKTLVQHGGNVLQPSRRNGRIALQAAVECYNDNALFLVDSCTPEIALRQLYWCNNDGKKILDYEGKNLMKDIVPERVKLIENLFTAAETGDLQEVENCFENEESPLSDVNRRNNMGDTALLCASRTGQVAVVKFLLGRNADRLIANDRACIPLHLAARWNQAEVALSLISGTEPEIVARQLAARDTDGRTPAQLGQQFRPSALSECLNQLEGEPSLHRALMGKRNAATQTSPETRETSLLLEQMLLNKMEAEIAHISTQRNDQFPAAILHDLSGNDDQCLAQAADGCSGDVKQEMVSLRQDVGDLGANSHEEDGEHRITCR